MVPYFLDSVTAADAARGQLDDRMLALAVLGIEAWVTMRDQQNDIQTYANQLDISPFLSVRWDLVWTAGDRTITVPRLRIEPSK